MLDNLPWRTFVEILIQLIIITKIQRNQTSNNNDEFSFKFDTNLNYLMNHSWFLF